MAANQSNYKTKTFRKGQNIFREGQKGDVAYLIKSGQITISRTIDNKEVVLETLEPGKVFGEMAVVTEAPRAATAVADDTSELVIIDQDFLNKALEESPQIVQRLADNLFARLRNTTERLVPQFVGDAFVSLCHLLELIALSRDTALDDERAARVSFNGFAERAKQMLGVTTLEIEETVEKLAGMGVVEVGQFKTGEHKWERTIRVFDPHGFRDQVERFLQTWQGEAGVHFLNQGFVELEEIAQRLGTDTSTLLQKAAGGGVPAQLLFVPRQAAQRWVEKGEPETPPSSE
jgi:CRP-like cAMP-binding protein